MVAFGWWGGGDGSKGLNDVWRSGDGVVWDLATDAAAFSGRLGHQVFSYGGSLWLVGGAYAQTHNDVWRSADGVVWTEVTVSVAVSGRWGHQVVSYGGSLWVLGGQDSQFQDKNDVWRSADGVNWAVATESAAFYGRNLHQAVSYGGSLWVIGGNDFSRRNDVWRSSDGVDWDLVTDAAAFSERSRHQVVVFRSSQYFHEATEVLMDSPGVQTAPAGGTVPMTLLTLTATGGVGALRFEVVGDDAGVATVGMDDGVLVVTNFLADGTRATITVRVRDSAPLNRAVVAVTLAFMTLVFSPDSAEYFVPPNYVGAVHTLEAEGWVGSRVYSLESKNAALMVNADSGVVSVVAGLAAGSRVTAVFAVGYEGGSLARFSLILRVDTSVSYENAAMYVIGGNDRNDVWRSADGIVWTEVTDSAPFSGNYREEVVSYGGSLWVVGGYDGHQLKNDIWRSADGVNWSKMAGAAPLLNSGESYQVVSHGGHLWLLVNKQNSSNFCHNGREVWRSRDGITWKKMYATGASDSSLIKGYHEFVSHGGYLWLMGGGADGAGCLSHNSKYGIWRSADGVNWTEFGRRAGVWPRQHHEVVSHGGYLWLIGGQHRYIYQHAGRRGWRTDTYKDMWRSADGVNWSRWVAGETLAQREDGRWVSHRGSFWVLGGEEIDRYDAVNWRSKYKNEVWHSRNGVNWTLATFSATGAAAFSVAFKWRYGHEVVVHRAPRSFVYETTQVMAGLEARAVGVRQVAVGGGEMAPVTVATVTATGGRGKMRFEVAGDEAGVATVGATSGVLVVTGFLGSRETATVSVRVRDSTPVNYAMVAVTMVYVFPVSLASAGYVFSPGYVGAVHSLVASGGLGSYSYERVAGPAAVSVDARTGIVSVVSALPAGSRETAVFEVRDEIGGSARSTLSLSITDSSGDYAMEMMFLVGGRDSDVLRNSESDVVWYSVDGADWVVAPVSRPLGPLSGHQVVSYRGSLWLVGGNDDQRYKNDVWRSGDGVNWELATVSAGFSGRHFHQVVSHGGSLWLVGGDYKNDVWRSGDGVVWTEVTGAAGFSGRSNHQVVSYGGSMWLVGGWDGSQYRSDVWRSADGVVWTEATVSAAFSGRSGHQAVSYGGSLWVVGGSDGSNRNDVWRSADGVDWTAVTASAAFLGRQFYQAVSYGGSLWVVGGIDSDGFRDDVWRSADGANWELVTESAAFSGRGGHQVVVFRPSQYFHEAKEILMYREGVRAVPVNGTVPMTLLTLWATGGVGTLRFDLVGDVAGVASVGADGALVVTSLLTDGVTATITARVRDSAPINNRAEVAVTLAFAFPLSFASLATEFVVSPDYVGVVHSLAVTGGGWQLWF